MPVDSKHPEFVAASARWSLCRDCYQGEDVIKIRGTRYLPKLGGQDDTEYLAYKDRALFYGAMARTVDGLTGLVMRKETQVVMPDEYTDFLNDVDGAGTTFSTFIKETVREVIKTGRQGVLIDMPSQLSDRLMPYFVRYTEQEIINWRTDDQDVLQMVVLQYVDYLQDPKDPFEQVPVVHYRHLFLNDEGAYTVRTYQTQDKDVALIDEVIPLNRGEALNYIPFVTINAGSLGFTVAKPPLLDLAFTNISHYRTMADLEHGRHLTALPTAYVAGNLDDTASFPLGSERAWLLPDGTNVGFLEFSGAGLQTLLAGSDEKKQMMAILGARLLEAPKKAAETAETARINRSGDSGNVVTIAQSVEDGMKQALAYMFDWLNVDPEYSVEINKDLVHDIIQPQLITALFSALQANKISIETFLYNLKKGEVLEEDVSIDEEIARIDTPSIAPVPVSVDEDEDEDEDEAVEVNGIDQ